MQIKSLASGSSGNCYHVSDGKTQLLIECGLPVREIHKRLGYGLSYVEACLISHSHGDHCEAAAEIVTAGVKVYASNETFSAIVADPGDMSPYYQYPVFPGNRYAIGTWTVKPFALLHDIAGALGFVCDVGDDRLVYMSNSPYCIHRFDRITHLMIESQDSNDILAANPVLNFLKSHDISQLREMWLLHLNESNDKQRLFRRAIECHVGQQVKVLSL